MKKYFKLQAKKSLSLFLAVLMLLSCWVWVAPEKAEAADQHDGYYKIRVVGHVTNNMDASGPTWTATLMNGGTASLTDNGALVNGNSGQAAITDEVWVNSFPESLKVNIPVTCGDHDDGRVEKNALQVYDFANSKWVTLHGEQQYNCAKNDTTSYEFWVDDSLNPVAKVVKNKNANVESKSLTIPAIGATNEVNAAFTAAGVYDQYDVKIGSTTYTIAGDNAGMTPYNKDEHGVWIDGTTVYANANVQTALPNKAGTNKLYVIAEGSGLKANIAEVTLNYPSYTVTVNPDGSISGLGATMNMSPDGTQTGTWTGTGAYSATADKYPNGTATKTGYDFKGFWTTQQPTSGAGSYNSATADFATPVSTTAFDTYKAQEGAVLSENNLVVTLADGSKYYNAGTQWDSAVHKEILGNKTFYGWWIPKDIVVKFYDVDGTFLGTQTTKFGSTPAENWYPNPKDGYNAGAYDYQGFAKQWRDITGAVITEGSYTFGALETLSLTPIYTNKTYSDKYQVNFVNPADGSNISPNSKEYDYRYILEGTDIPTVAVPAVLVNDPGYSYEFTGWTSQKPASGNYHKVAKDDTTITENTDWVVREEIKYYPIFRSTVKEYLVNFNYTDSTGAAKTESLVVPYGSAIVTPDVVNRTYATGGYGYTLEGWDYQTNTGATVMLGADATLVFDNTKVFITTNNLAPNGTPIVFTANYDEGKPTPYTVTFKFKDAEGKDKVITDEVYHGYTITQGTVDKLTVPAQYDDGTALYTFSNLWKVTEGTADKAEYNKDEFTSFAPTSHVTFEALYGEGVPFYTVTYIDGDATYSERVLAGSNVPAWTVEETDAEGNVTEKEYTPVKEKTETGEYKFEGWFDAEQTDKDFAETNGTEYTTASEVNGDLVLYPQFKFSPFKFTIKFMNYDGTVQLAIAEVEAGQSFEAAFAEAQRAAQYRAPDETYSYTFIGWDYKVPENYLCEGKDMTYTAQYRPSYVYYKANWYNSADEIDGTPLATTNHTYNGAVYAPSVELTIPEGKAFAGWKYLKDGVEADYVRGMTITEEMSFYATYKDAAKIYTVTAVVGNITTEYKVAEGDKVDIGRPLDGYVDETNHNKFVGWFTVDGAEFDLDTEIEADITITAKFDLAEHNKDQKELVSAPTYYAKGSEKVWCSCNRTETEETVEIAMLTDTVAPTGTIYLGGYSWSSEGAPAYETDNDPISIFVNANADIVITSNDKGDVNDAYNPSGIGKGVANIRAFAFPAETVLTAENYGAAQSLAVDVYTNDTTDLNNNANFSIKLGEIFVADLTEAGEVQYNEDGSVKFKSLEDGESYIIYYYINDKAGNQLNRKVRTAKFIYDATAPEITVEGDSNEAGTTYCGKAVIKGIENGATVTVNGEEVTLTTAGASGVTAYTIKEAGNYIITVTDKAGNTDSKKIIVTDGHDEVETSKAATCDEDGYEKITCAVCGKVIKDEKIESEGHKYGEVETIDPTCDEEGYGIKICSVCGDEVKTNVKPAAGHKHAKDAEGNLIYEVVTPATCCVEGKKISNCTVCGLDTKTETIPVDDENGHNYGGTKVLKATCTKDGEKYQNCKYCFEKKTVEVLPKLNHVDTGRYTKVTTEATCYSEGVETTYCKACDTVMGTAPVAMIAHTLVLVKYDKDTDKSDDYPNGYMQYECKATGCTHTEGKTAIAVKATYTVTFKGAGAEGADVVITKTEGESIEATAVADQTKASDGEYNYTFAGWKAESTGKVVKLPVEVTKNETYTAEFTATKRIYTHTFKINKEDEATFATIIGTYNDENKKPVAVPTKEATDTVTYEFAGWTDALGKDVADFTMTGDATFIAKFDEKAIKYNVNFYNGKDLFESVTVVGGAKVDEPANDPTKDYDAENHYTFAGWYADSEFKTEFDFANTEIKAATRIYAKFTAVKHEFDETVEDETKTWGATCTKEGQITEKCDCGCEKITSVPMIEHNYELQEDGSKKCSVCGDTVAPEVKVVTIKFMDGDKVLEKVELEEGKTFTFTAPEKASTAEYEYTFVKWTCDGAEDVNTAEITVTAGTADAVYTANYTATKREYYVTYFDADYSVLQKTKVAYGDVIPAFTGKTPTKAPTTSDHYTFSDWSVAAGTIVKGQIDITPNFNHAPHDFVEGATSTPATCTQPGSKDDVCKVCEFKVPGSTTTPATGHKYVEVPGSRIDADYGIEGYVKYECQNENCPEKIKEVRTPALTYKTLTVTVLNASAGAIVELRGAETTVRRQIDDNAKAVFGGLKDGNYTIVVDGAEQTVTVNADTEITIDVKAGSSGEDDGSQAPSCSCGCHRPGFWGIVFRFFHKIISWFTGRIGCCECPDPAY